MSSQLGQYFTNLDRPVFGLKLPQEVAAMLFSRYSRSTKGLRELFQEEFLPLMDEIESTKELDVEAKKKAQSFFDRVLIGYGDDSVSQLGAAHLSCEGISQIAELFITDARIGIAPLVKSTRYVRFDHKDERGNYAYHTLTLPKDCEALYHETMNLLFDTYSQLMEPTQEWLLRQIPQGESPDKAYAASIRAKACDILRAFLPASTLTNVGIFATGQAWEHLLIKGYSMESGEIPALTSAMHQELQQLIPSFVKRASPSEYLIHTAHDMTELTKDWEENKQEWTNWKVELQKWTDHGEWKVLCAIIEPFNKQLHPLYTGDSERINLLQTYIGNRRNRRDKPGRALEHADYTFQFCANLGIYRDLHRHRILTQERQLISPHNGYDTPPELIEMGYKSLFDECMEKTKSLYDKIAVDSPFSAQYCVPFAFKQRWYMKMNLREALHICELRSQPSGHPDYRKIVQEMWRQITEVHPLFAHIQNFVDFGDYQLGRLAAEVRTEQKRGEYDKRI